MRKVDAWTDGSCFGAPGPGGWAALLKSGSDKILLTGGSASTLTGRAEIMAVITALRFLRKPSVITLYSDSQYVVNSATTWAAQAKKRGWLGASGQPFKNVDLWEELLRLQEPHVITYYWVRGHAGNEGNEIVDVAARDAARTFFPPGGRWK